MSSRRTTTREGSSELAGVVPYVVATAKGIAYLFRSIVPNCRDVAGGSTSMTEDQTPGFNDRDGARHGVCTIYVDVENLGGAAKAQKVIRQVVADWSAKCPNEDFPFPSGLALYVPADKVELWKTWTNAKFDAIERQDFRGVQHFSKDASKNSADIAIVADAVVDFATGRTTHVAVVSNDSDFGALFVKIREITEAEGRKPVPFLWITASGTGLSDEIKQFIAPPFRWNLNIQPQQTKTADVAKANSNKAMVEHLISTLPLGTFKAGDVQEVVKKRWPQHVAGSSSGTCGKWLRDVWPLLEAPGIKEVRTNSPRTYEITEGAKKIN